MTDGTAGEDDPDADGLDADGHASEREGGELAAAVDRFLADAETALGEYDQGYVDADATLSVLRGQLDKLREAAENDHD